MAVIWEAFTAYLDDRFEENKASRELLSKVYKELMILGFISFMVIMSREFGLYISPEQMHCFEFADMLVTISMLIYISCSIIVSFSMHVTRRKWDRIAMMPTDQIISEVDKQVR